MGCIVWFCLVVSVGRNHTESAELSSRNKAKGLGFFFAPVLNKVLTVGRYSGDPFQEVSTLSRLIDALGPDVSVVSISGGSIILMEALCKYLGSGYQQNLIDYPCFDLRPFKRCLQRKTSSVFGSLNGFAMTEFIVDRLKGAETREWMWSRPALRKAILPNDLAIPHLVGIVANIIVVWPLIVC